MESTTFYKGYLSVTWIAYFSITHKILAAAEKHLMTEYTRIYLNILESTKI